MTIRRSELQFDRDFTIMPNAWARDERLSRKARGLLVELLSHTVGWTESLASLVSKGVEGREAIRSAIRELEDAGYLVRSQRRDEGGRFESVDYELCDPMSENPTSDGRTPKKTISQKTNSQNWIRSLAPRTTPSASGVAASPQQVALLRDLVIHSTGRTPSREDEGWLNSLSRGDAWSATQRMLAEMPRYDEYNGPRPGDEAYEALSTVGKMWADTGMLPEWPAAA